GIADNLLQFSVETLVATGPVNLGGGSRKEEGHKSREIAFEHLFPGAVIVCHRRAALLYVHTLGRAAECSRTRPWSTRMPRCSCMTRWPGTIRTQDDSHERQVSDLVDLYRAMPGLDARAGEGDSVVFFQARSGSDEMYNQLLSDGVKSSGGQAVFTLGNLST